MKYERHGLRDSAEYRAWSQLRQRCTNPNNNRFATYGARGITFDPAWKSFVAFYRDMGPRPSKNHSLHRSDNNLGYSKQNCVWATDVEQANRTSKNFYVQWKGHTYSVAELSKATGVQYFTLITRLYRGWSVDEAVIKPRPSLRAKAIAAGIPYATVYHRVKRGWSEKEALSQT